MDNFDVDYLLHKHGLIAVWDPIGYHGFHPEDICEGKIREGACPAVSFSGATLRELSKEKGDEFIEMCKRVKNHHPYDASYPYIVSPLAKESTRRKNSD